MCREKVVGVAVAAISSVIHAASISAESFLKALLITSHPPGTTQNQQVRLKLGLWRIDADERRSGWIIGLEDAGWAFDAVRGKMTD